MRIHIAKVIEIPDNLSGVIWEGDPCKNLCARLDHLARNYWNNWEFFWEVQGFVNLGDLGS